MPRTPAPTKVFSWSSERRFAHSNGMTRQITVFVAAKSQAEAIRLGGSSGARRDYMHEISRSIHERRLAAARALPGVLLATESYAVDAPITRYDPQTGFGKSDPVIEAAIEGVVDRPI